MHLLPRATGAPGCCLRTWLNLRFQTAEVSVAEQNSAAPSAWSPRPGGGEDLPATALQHLHSRGELSDPPPAVGPGREDAPWVWQGLGMVQTYRGRGL